VYIKGKYVAYIKEFKYLEKESLKERKLHCKTSTFLIMGKG